MPNVLQAKRNAQARFFALLPAHSTLGTSLPQRKVTALMEKYRHLKS